MKLGILSRVYFLKNQKPIWEQEKARIFFLFQSMNQNNTLREVYIG